MQTGLTRYDDARLDPDAPVYSRHHALRSGLAMLGLGALGSMLSPAALTRALAATAAASPHGVTAATLSALVASARDFGFDLFGQLTDIEPTANVFISPLSVATALSMTYNGAHGATATAMGTALKVQDLSLEQVNGSYATLLPLLTNADPSVQLTIADALYARAGIAFRQTFLQRVAASYAARVTTLDFTDPRSLTTINAWVNAQTHGLISRILDQINKRAIMYLLNAVYFKGQWTTQFDPAKTTPRPFTLLDGTTRSVPMMSLEADFSAYRGPIFQAVMLPYGVGKLGFYAIVPDTGTTLAQLRAALTPVLWQRIVSGMSIQRGMVNLPRFSVAYSAKTPALRRALAALGMDIAFDQNKADFSNMVAGVAPTPSVPGRAFVGKRVYIGEMAHKAIMQVDEQGTTAAAITNVGAYAVAVNVLLNANRPFFCAIRENSTGAILFMGQIVDPLAA